MKRIITNSPVLINFYPKKEISIICDSSSSGLGCCLMQEGKPVAFASRNLIDPEKQYPQIDKESIIFSCRKFHNYIYWYHSPLTSIYTKNFNKVLSNRLQKMKLKLLIYDLEINYLPDEEMLVV